jgi:hypothetical protein
MEPCTDGPNADDIRADQVADSEALAALAATLSLGSMLEYWDNVEDDAAWSKFGFTA